MKIDDNSIIQSLENENTEIKQGALIYLLTESFSILHHIFESNTNEKECKMLTEDLIELIITSRDYCKRNNIDWEKCKSKITENKHNNKFNAFIKALDL